MLHMLLDALANRFLFFALHLSNTGSFPAPLSAEEEQRALEAHANGDKAARDQLIEHNLRLVVHVIKKYYATCMEQDDLISVGTIGLIKAINTFNVGKAMLSKNRHANKRYRPIGKFYYTTCPPKRQEKNHAFGVKKFPAVGSTAEPTLLALITPQQRKNGLSRARSVTKKYFRGIPDFQSS